MLVRKIGRTVFRYVPGKKHAFAVYEWIVNRIISGSLRPEGFHSVTVSPSEVDSFDIWLPMSGRSHREQLRGEYETEVTRLLAQRIDSDSIFWEVGGGYGFHSLAWAQVAETVVTFEASTGKVEKIRESVKKNGFENVEVVPGVVGKGVSLEEYPPPDVVVLDVEGSELQILEDSPKILSMGPDWVIEVHERSIFDDGIDPQRIYSLFEEAEYRWETISERKPGNYHVFFTRSD